MEKQFYVEVQMPWLNQVKSVIGYAKDSQQFINQVRDSLIKDVSIGTDFKFGPVIPVEL